MARIEITMVLPPRSRALPFLFGSLLLAFPFAAVAAPDALAGAAQCDRTDQLVALRPGEGPTWRLAGWFCHDGTPSSTVILASPTGISEHSYWDWPAEPDAFSFVQHATTKHGFSVFNYDRIGTGLSDRPPAALVTVQSEAFVVHQLVQRIKSGDIGDAPEPRRVVLLGNSLSTFIHIAEAETYGDADGLVNTGILIGPRPQGLATLMSMFYPAQMDPKFAGRNDIPLGYATTQPGTRAAFFYGPTAEERMIALDEELKDTATAGEAGTFPATYPETRRVGMPVLSIVGDRDVLFCDPACEPNGIEATRERLHWSDATCFELHLLPDVGHFVQLHREGARSTEALVADWVLRRVGDDAEGPPTDPCE